jgi:hypothetical protein
VTTPTEVECKIVTPEIEETDINDVDVYKYQHSLWKIIAITFAVSLVTTVFGFVIFHYFSSPSSSINYGTVDLESIVETNQLMLMDKVTGSSVSDTDRMIAFESAKSFGINLSNALTKVKSDCDCDLLVKSAIVIGNTKDYTNDVKLLLGLDKVNVDQLKLKFSNEIKAKIQ